MSDDLLGLLLRLHNDSNVEDVSISSEAEESTSSFEVLKCPSTSGHSDASGYSLASSAAAFPTASNMGRMYTPEGITASGLRLLEWASDSSSGCIDHWDQRCIPTTSRVDHVPSVASRSRKSSSVSMGEDGDMHLEGEGCTTADTTPGGWTDTVNIGYIPTSLTESAPRQKLVSSVHLYKTDSHLDAVVRELVRGMQRYHGNRGFGLIAVHPDEDGEGGHIHVIHDCSYSNGSCRCIWIRNQRPIRNPRRPRTTASLTEGDFGRLLLYYSKQPRYITYLQICGRKVRIPAGLTLDEIKRRCQRPEGSMVEEIEWEHDDLLQSRQPSIAGGTESVPVNEERVGEARGWCAVPKTQTKVGKLEHFMHRNYVCPLENITLSKLWLASPYMHMHSNHKDFMNAAQTLQNRFTHLSIKELELFWEDKNSLFWELEEYRSLGSATYPLDRSVELAEKFLLYQYNYSEAEVAKFLTRVVDILDRRVPKRNCMEVIGRPCSGKNYFFDPIFLFCGSSGQVMNANKYQQFPLDNCVNKRVMFMNEPVCEASFMETLKMICAGNRVNANKKYCPHIVINRTPLFVLSNTPFFPRAEAWECRIVRERWNTCEWLKECTHHLDPRFFIALCKQYSIQY